VVLEDLDTSGFIGKKGETRTRRRRLYDCAFSELRACLEWGFHKYGKQVLAVSAYNTSRECFLCGRINQNLTLKDRVYRYGVCDPVADRDFNTSKNLRKIGLIKVGPVQPESGETAISDLYGMYSYRQTSVAEAGSSKVPPESSSL
jgi:putative transposase